MARNRMTWRTKLLIAFVVALIFTMAAALTPWGHDFAKGWVREAYNTMPEEERRTSKYADAWVFLAWWSASIRGDEKEGMDMYLEFCGALPDPKTKLDFTTTLKLTGLCSPDGTSGWGPMHPRAPEAFYLYMEHVETLRSAQVHNEEMFRCHRLFYQWCSRFGEKKINPCFKKYWIQMRDRGAFRRIYWPGDIDKNVPAAPESPEDC